VQQFSALSVHIYLVTLLQFEILDVRIFLLVGLGIVVLFMYFSFC
jgi:hypothetical protein